MQLKSNSSILNIMSKINKFVLSGLLMATLGCAQMQEQETRIGEGAASAPQDADDFQGTPPPVPVSTPGQEAPVRTANKVAVILGPGGYKSFAHVGVLKELRKQNIPIQKIVGLEWGALVAGLYSQRGQVNEVEWKLYKLEKLDLNSGGFFGRRKEMQSTSILYGFLKENLDLKEIGQATVPFSCPALSLSQGALQWQERGSLMQAVGNCISYPPLFSPENGMVAGLFSLEDVVMRLKQEGYNVIVLVNVIGDGNLFDNSTAKEDYASAILWSEVRRQVWRAKSLVTDYIEVNTRGISFSAFESRKILVTAGEAAGEKASAKLVSKYGF